MSVLLVHPDDSPVEGPWAEQSWEVVLDLGWAGRAVYREWERQLGCPVRGFNGYAEGPEDFQKIGEALGSCRGMLVDDAGLDWWEILAPLRVLEMLYWKMGTRVVRELGGKNLAGTRFHPMAAMLGKLAGREIRYLRERKESGLGGRWRRMKTAASLLTPPQLLQAALDKWDMGYRMRSWATPRRGVGAEGAVLLPSSYANVTRMLNAYAKLLPEQKFLLVTTRRGGEMADLAGNVRSAPLAGFAKSATAASTRKEARALGRSWIRMQDEVLRTNKDLAAASENGLFHGVGTSLEQWLRVRDAWKSVLVNERIGSVLCGDENNATNRIPVLLAAKRNLRTVHCDHGALNALLPLRSPACDTYLVKGEMEADFVARTSGIAPERIVRGAPGTPFAIEPEKRGSGSGRIVFFSEQLELTMGRQRILYQEVLPRLCILARESGTRLVVKLHPFESPAQRRAFIDAAVPAQDRELVDLVHGPLTEELLGNTWFALTVESSVAVDCAIRGIRCFLCGWFTTPISGYDQQFVTYGAAQSLAAPEDVTRIPEMLRTFELSHEVRRSLWDPITPARLGELLKKP